MHLRQRSLALYSVFMLTALIVITFGISLINKSDIEKRILHLIPELRRALIEGDNRSVREIIRGTIRYPLINFQVERFDGILVDSQNSTENKALFLFVLEAPLILAPSDKSIGSVRVTYSLEHSLINGLLLWFIFLTASYPIFLQFRKNLIRIEALNMENAKSSAIARTTQMLAHDMRKPFNLFRMTVDRVKAASTSQQAEIVLQEALPEVERSLAKVNGLITDVLNVGGKFILTLKPVCLNAIVEEVVDEIRKLYPSRTLVVEIDLAPGTWVQADDTRLPRVFLNILSNAVEAVETSTVQLWIKGQNVADDVIEICAGNSGSFISAEAREKLFELFYTSGKKGGTGLGLAIVKKIIAGHGSNVECVSESSARFPDGKVEFLWQMKRSVDPLLSMPFSDSVDSFETSSRVVERPSVNTEKPKVVFLDDSPLVRWAWEASLKSQVALQCMSGPRDFWSALENGTLFLDALHTIITDYYFSPDENVTGVEFASAIRQRGFKGRVLLASNGEFDPLQLDGVVDRIVGKQPASWEKLCIS